MRDVRIRHRRAADLDRCVEVLAAVHRRDRYPLNWPADPRRWLDPPDTLRAWVAEAAVAGPGPTLAGHLALQPIVPAGPAGPSSRPVAVVSRLFVAPAFRRLAVASALLRHAQRWAAEHDLDLTLEVAASQNAAAVALYERTGWRHSHTTEADWTTPDGDPVTLRHYVFPGQNPADRP